jgi:hypothetical protein
VLGAKAFDIYVAIALRAPRPQRRYNVEDCGQEKGVQRDFNKLRRNPNAKSARQRTDENDRDQKCKK